MAYKNKIINNPKTGQTIKFLQTSGDTGGTLLEMESVFAPGSTEPPAHYHPCQQENFTILKGELRVRINGKLKQFGEGESFQIPKNTSHSMWNNSTSMTTVHWQVAPALNTENFFEEIMGLAVEGKTNQQGMPNILQVALIANKYNKIFRLSRPSFMVQKIVFAILSPFAYLSGYKSSYDKYVN
jgi:quercetin dioxygenase-like cupin family protein